MFIMIVPSKIQVKSSLLHIMMASQIAFSKYAPTNFIMRALFVQIYLIGNPHFKLMTRR